MALARRGLPCADSSPRPAPQAHDDHRCHGDYEAGGHAALDAALDWSRLSKISMAPTLTRNLPRKVPQSVPRRVTYTGKLRGKGVLPRGGRLRSKAGSKPPGLAVSAAVESGPDRTHELADLTGRCTLQRSAHQG